MGVAIQYPASWQVYTDTMEGRHSGLNPILLASFEVEFEEVEAELARRFGTSGLVEKASRSRTHP